MQQSTFPSHFCCRCTSRCATRGTTRTRGSQDPSGILGTLAEPTGTDGCRVLCHQFSTSSLLLLENCFSRCNNCSPTVKPMTPALLRWLINGDQGQKSRTTVFPLSTGH